MIICNYFIIRIEVILIICLYIQKHLEGNMSMIYIRMLNYNF